ncbi:MAG: hypothetical protein KAW17_09635 [Candidatus Eisenbacteria sp.]|nr:hypothetical protein [Candidatus Eisenbacteria bacterium]
MPGESTITIQVHVVPPNAKCPLDDPEYGVRIMDDKIVQGIHIALLTELTEMGVVSDKELQRNPGHHAGPLLLAMLLSSSAATLMLKGPGSPMRVGMTLMKEANKLRNGVIRSAAAKGGGDSEKEEGGGQTGS